MKVQENIISPRYGEPVIGGMQDYISGAYLMTRDGAEFSAEKWKNAFMSRTYCLQRLAWKIPRKIKNMDWQKHV